MFSDINWEHTVIDRFPGITFYDYTKHIDRAYTWLRLGMPANYHVMLSHNERLPESLAREWLSRGSNIAICYDSYYNGRNKIYGRLPIRHHYAGQWRDVVDGDSHDVRLPSVDGIGKLVGLRFKSNASTAESAHPNSRFYVRITDNRNVFDMGGKS